MGKQPWGKKSSLPSRVYKYALLPPTDKIDFVTEAFENVRIHYNKIITAHLVSRNKYRAKRAQLFPELVNLETQAATLEKQIDDAYEEIKAAKIAGHTRAVPPELAAKVKGYKAELKMCRANCKAARKKFGSTSPELQAAAQQYNDECRATIAALRPTCYSGNYLLIEAAARSACSKSKDPEYNEDPPHRLASRIGVHVCGGMSVDDLATSTLFQINPMPTWHVRTSSGIRDARGKRARTTLKFRVASDANRRPIFATFPMVMHRPLPDDCRIKDAYITRRPYTVRIPWRYDLCIVLESGEFEKRNPHIEQVGTTSINFGWRLIDGELRVATINNSERGREEIRLPWKILDGFALCERLQGILSTNFDKTKSDLTAWLADHEVPVAFREAFTHLPSWKSQHRLAELCDYWRGHRIPGDEEIFAVLVENMVPVTLRDGSTPHRKDGSVPLENVAWLGRYRHLGDWLAHARQNLFNWRNNFYRETAKRLATTSTVMIIDTFEMSKVARRTKTEERKTGGDAARANRMIAAPGELRLALLHAAQKYHCDVPAVKTENKTRRCNACGHINPAAIIKLKHTCIDCGAVWDQDMNNTDNLDDDAADGKVVPFVRPAKISKTGQSVPSERSTFTAARQALKKL